MRFYFHLRIGQQVSPDEIGLELPDLETAYLEAFQAAQDMWGELLSERSDPLLRSFEVADEHGQHLLTLPFKEVLDRASKPSPPASALARIWQSMQAQMGRHRDLAAALRAQIAVTRDTVQITRETLARSRRQTQLMG